MEAYDDGGQDLIEVVHDLDLGLGLDMICRSFSGCFGKGGGSRNSL